MPQIQQKFEPHPKAVSHLFDPTLRPSIAFDSMHLFRRETELLIQLQLNALQFNYQDALQGARLAFLQNNGTIDLWLLILYHEIIERYASETNGDGVFHDEQLYMGLVTSPVLSAALKWISQASMRQTSESLRKGDSTLMSVGATQTPIFAYGQGRVYHNYEEEDTSLQETTQALSHVSTQIAELAKGLKEFTDQAFFDHGNERIPGTKLDMADYYKLRRRGTPVVQIVTPQAPAPALVEQAPEVQIEDIRNLDLEAFLNYAMTERKERTNIIDNKTLSIFWFSPPPIGLNNLYEMKTLTNAEKVFLGNVFSDTYTAESHLLCLHFLLRRLRSLWTPSQGIIEDALYSVEVDAIKQYLHNISTSLDRLFVFQFFNMEGIFLPGQKCVDLVDSLFSQNSTGGLGTIYAITEFLQELIEPIRNACVAVDRLRVSLLYGPGHPSYVGDEFLASYLYRYYLVRHTSKSMNMVLNTTQTFVRALLPNDTETSYGFYNKLLEKTLPQAKNRHFQEGESRTDYVVAALPLGDNQYSSGRQSQLPVTDPIRSLYPRTPESDRMIELMDKARQDPQVCYLSDQSEALLRRLQEQFQAIQQAA